jgi:MFS family permease
MLLGALAFSALEIMFALSSIYPLSLVLIASVGFAQIAMSAVANTTLQTIAPNRLRGRVMSVYMMVFAGSVPLGNLFIGGIAHLYSAPVALLAGGLLSLLAATLGWIWRKPAEKDLAANFDESPVASAAAHD